MHSPRREQTSFVSDVFEQEENFQDNDEGKPMIQIAPPHKKWSLQMKIWSIVILIIGLLNIPLIFFGRSLKWDDNGHLTAVIFFLTFRWEHLVSAGIMVPTGIIGLVSGFTDKIWSIKLVLWFIIHQ